MSDFIATNNGDFLIGTNGDDIISGLAGNDTIAGMQGHDSVDGGTGFDQFNLRMGNGARFNAATGARTYTVTADRVGESSGRLNFDFSNIEHLDIAGRFREMDQEAQLNKAGQDRGRPPTGDAAASLRI